MQNLKNWFKSIKFYFIYRMFIVHIRYSIPLYYISLLLILLYIAAIKSFLLILKYLIKHFN